MFPEFAEAVQSLEKSIWWLVRNENVFNNGEDVFYLCYQVVLEL